MVTIKENFLSETDFLKVQRLSTKIFVERDKYQLDTNYRRWPPYIIKGSNVVLIYDIFEEEIWDIFQKATNRDIKHIMFYYWMENSYIPWHDDGHEKGAGTLYLNESWKKEYGGIYLYETPNKKINSILPERNLFVDQYEYEHATTPINREADIRQTVQIFYNDSKRNT